VRDSPRGPASFQGSGCSGDRYRIVRGPDAPSETLTETYTLVGTGISWVFAVSFVSTSVASGVVFYVKKASIAFIGYLAGSVLFGVAAKMVGCSLELTIAALTFLGAVLVMTKLGRKAALALRLAFAFFYLFIGYIFLDIGLGADPIVFSDRYISITSMQRRYTVARASIHTESNWAPGFAGSGSNRDWTLESGDGPGAMIEGAEVYWGPHGFINGNDLGARIAKWARTASPSH
jgi:hypothetical protein